MITLGRQTENVSERKTDRQKQRREKKEREIKFISMCHCIQMTQNYFLNQ